MVLYHNTTLQKGYQAMLHCGVGPVPHEYTLAFLISSQAVRQTVRITAMDHPQGVLRTGDRATVQFEFISHPEYMAVGSKILFREGTTKVLHVDCGLMSHFN